MLANMFYLQEHYEEVVMILLIDVTDIRTIEKELMNARDSAERTAKAKSDFLANMSHEIRTPLNAIIGMTKIARKSENTLKIKEYLAKIDNSSNHLLTIINDILDLSKIDSGKFELYEEDFDIEYVLSNIMNIILVKTEEKNHILDVKIKNNVPKYFHGDLIRLTQVIMNLLSNAVKFTPHNGKIKLELEMENIKNDKAVIKFSVTDNGIGISKEQMSKIFMAFEQADGSITKRFGGTGLGLSISKKIVEMMGGEITVKSELGKGSIFSFTASIKALENKNKNILPPNRAQSLKIMTADNDADSACYLADILKNHGMETELAQDGFGIIIKTRQAICEDKPYDIIFISENIYGMNIVDIVRMIKQAGAQTKIIVISKYGYGEKEEELRNEGINEFLQKPFFSSNVINIISRVTGINAAAQANSEKFPYIFPDKTIMLVEDIEINREIIINLLSSTKVNIVSAENGRQAVDMYKSNPERFDLILMDIQMPEMDGYTAARTIRSCGMPDAEKIPILALTANAFDDDIDNAFLSGMNGHLTKPINEDKIIKILAQYFSPGEKYEYTEENISDTKVPGEDEEIDISGGIKSLGGNEELYFSLLKNFSQETLIDELVSAAEKKDMAEAKLKAHSLKGIAANLSMTKLYESSKTLEAEIKAGVVTDETGASFIKLKKDYLLTINRVKSILKNRKK
jgi:signal transduction histidine kinase/DNA-binding response OmpR family regulator/HPt (histidine-containing phosphotransfer) domain-containing protein